MRADYTLKTLRLHIARFFTFVVALQIINMGLFVQDFQYNISSSICDQNVINSVVEYVSEVVLNKTNSMPEYDTNNHNKDLQIHKHAPIKLMEFEAHSFAVTVSPHIVVSNAPLIQNYCFQFCKEINPPPPKSINTSC